MKIVALSDTHCRLHKLDLPDGDLLIHAGDLTGRGHDTEVQWELDKLAKLNDRYQDTIIIAGNHDWLAETNPTLMREMCKDRDITYLCDSEVIIDGIKFYGSPQTPWFYDWAFNCARTEGNEIHGPWIKHYWDMIPLDTNVLITHGPPGMILDEVLMANGDSYNPPRRAGCDELYEAVKRVKPKVHIFGHIHSGYGKLELEGTRFYNVSICDEMYSASNPITEIEL